MDHKFTDQIKQWLEKPEDERDYSVGALYLLKLSGNQIMYRNIIAQIDRRHDVVDYQLQKYYNFRVQVLTHAQVEEMAAQVETIVAEHISLAATADEQPQKGKRPDHDTLKSRRSTLRTFRFSNVCANCICVYARFRLKTRPARTPSVIRSSKNLYRLTKNSTPTGRHTTIM